MELFHQHIPCLLLQVLFQTVDKKQFYLFVILKNEYFAYWVRKMSILASLCNSKLQFPVIFSTSIKCYQQELSIWQRRIVVLPCSRSTETVRRQGSNWIYLLKLLWMKLLKCDLRLGWSQPSTGNLIRSVVPYWFLRQRSLITLKRPCILELPLLPRKRMMFS